MLEEILNHLISVDEECKRVLNEVQEKKDNIEYLVNDELTKRKDEIKAKYKFKMDMKKNEYDMKLAENSQNIEARKKQEIEQIKKKYAEDKSHIIQEMLQAIL